jgi:AraC-like DNA-binding protein
MRSVFEKIDHQRFVPVKAFITQIDSSRPHWHYDYEILVILEGKLQVFCDSRSFIMETGDIALFNTKEIHGFTKTNCENICLYIQFSPVVFSSILDENQAFAFYLNSVTDAFSPRIPYRDFTAAACRVGQAARSRDPGARLRVTALMLTLAADLLDFTEHEIRSAAASPEESADFGEGILPGLISFIDSNLQSETLADDIYRKFRTSQKQLYRYLKGITGLTLKDLIDAARIEKSKQLLRMNTIKISEIADECGFASEATFFRVFRKETGKTPRDFRHGMDSLPSDESVRGYLRFSEEKAERLLEEFAAGSK